MTITHPPSGFTMRPPNRAESLAVTEVLNACEIESRGRPGVVQEEIVEIWTAPGFDLATDARVIVGSSGSIEAYAEFERNDTPTQIVFDGYVHPRSRDAGLGARLLDWAETRAVEIADAAPRGAASRLLTFLWTTETHGAALLESHGYTISRHFYNLVIGLQPPPPEPRWPKGITARTFVPGDALALHAADEEAFRDHWGFVETPFELFSHFNLEGENFDPSLVFLAMDGGEIAGAAICPKHRAEDAAKGWVGDLFVRRPWRRRGIAKALLLTSFAEYRSRGYERVGLGVDTENPTGALDLYFKAGMTVESEGLCFEKELARGE